ncbi:MAG: Hemolysins and related proteins containing CBS domains [uncultured Rubrobacteraceae bacterium]|uniref:Hemolysins and related proteins containing CBS domains n=1 Tax=uncultured Rubrobacteraceae bacterium TaxID=349277 RepID=A0A6J4S5D7_9ACTN|nr:MAG: Hemolysins and related proteins containing CBS domains [uncultured Rubrobacteraceae bacterium]
MESLIFSGLGILGALLLVALNGVFVAAEFAFVKLRSAQVEKMVQDGRASARIVQGATNKLDRYLAVSQLGITVSSLGLGALGEPAIARLLEPVLAALGFSESLIHAVAFAIGFGIITFLHVVFGELAPKSFAIQKPEGTSLFVAPLMRIFYYLLLPGVVVFNGTANAIVRIFGVAPAAEGSETYSEQEIRTLIAQSTRQGILEKDEESRLSGVFNLEDTAAREIMVPRPDVVVVPADLGLKDLIAVTAAGHYTRYPVHEGEAHDRIVGSVHVKDILRAVESHGGVEADVTARDLMRDVLMVPENRSIENVLEDFQKQKIQVAVVIDEWGSFEGLVTIEDILEEIVGEIRDEFDEAEPAVQSLPDGSYAIDGRIPISVVNEALETGFESEDFDTIGGLVLGALGRVPEVDDEVALDGHVLRVDDVDGPRVAQVIVRERKDGDGPTGGE